MRHFEVQEVSAAWNAGGILLFGAAIGLFALAIAVANLSGPVRELLFVARQVPG